MSTRALLAAAGLAACSGEAPRVTAAPSLSGVRVTADRPLSGARLVARDGTLVASVRAPVPCRELTVAADLDPGDYVVEAAPDGEAAVSVPLSVPAATAAAEVQLAPGGAWLPLDGAREVPVIEGGAVDVLVARRSERGVRHARAVRVSTSPVEVFEGAARGLLVPRAISRVEAAAALEIESVSFPAQEDGAPELARAPGVIWLPAAWWDRVARATGSGGRRRDAYAPWSFTAVTLRNASDQPLDVTLAHRVLDGETPAAAFRPRLRDADDGTGRVSALVRVPANGTAIATLPLFVDGDAVDRETYTSLVEATAVGSEVVLDSRRSPLPVRRGDTASQAGFLASVAVAAVGLAWAARALPRLVRQARTVELMTLATFASATFVLGTASDLLALATAAVLGPFATLLTGLVSDLPRTLFQATLVTLQPRPGWLALSLLTSYLVRGLAMGSLAPSDALFLGAGIAAQEGCAWIAGLTRGRPISFARLAVGLGGAATAMALVGLWIHVVLFRLYFAPWYIALQVLVPGLLYTVLACALAVPFAASLRRVSS